MATDAKELERVRRIHAALDCARSKGCPDGATYDQLSHVLTFDGHSYTAAEVRAWPKLKEAFMIELHRSGLPFVLWAGWRSPPEAMSFVCAQVGYAKDRGLCMYREQLSDALSPGRALTEDGGVRVNEEQAEALGTLTGFRVTPAWVKEQQQGADHSFRQAISGHWLYTEPAKKPRVDPYNPDGLKPEVRLEFEKGRRVAMDDKDVRSGRREKLVAALAAELSKPVAPRFPAEGRQDRALSVTNGMIRGRE